MPKIKFFKKINIINKQLRKFHFKNISPLNEAFENKAIDMIFSIENHVIVSQLDKEIHYNPDKLDYSICFNSNKKNMNIININDLSSGEKQIVALFTLLYLNDENRGSNNKKMVLIDEPELSLSLKWQRMLLPDIASGDNCSMIIAMTHSPFIFDNEFDMATLEIHRKKANY